MGIRACFDPFSLVQVDNLRRAEETDAEPVERAGGEAVGRRVGVSGEYGAGEAGAEVLDGADGAPEHALPAAAVVGVRVEEPRRGMGRREAQEDPEPPDGESEDRGDDGEEAGQDRHGWMDATPSSLEIGRAHV